MRKLVLSIFLITMSLMLTSCSFENTATKAATSQPPKNFSADMISTINGTTSGATLLVRGSKIRMEVTGGRRSSIMIADYELGKLWLLIPSTSQYKEYPISEMGNTVPQFFDPKINIEKKELGSDTVSDVPALKYEVKIKDKDKEFEGILWEAKSLPGYPLKWKDANAKIEVHWKNAKTEKVAASNFDIPKEYTELKTVSVEQDDSQCR